MDGVTIGELQQLALRAIMPQFFSNTESAWITSLGPNFKAWRRQHPNPESPMPFIKEALKQWYDKFPFRHPRQVRHRARNATEAKKVISGQRWKGMVEVSP